MTALGVSLLLVGAIVVLVETHVPSYGFLGGPGVVMLAVGAVLGVAGLGGGIALGVVSGLLLASVGAGAVLVSLRKGLAVRRRRIRTGAEGLIGHVGLVRRWNGDTGSVAVDGALWRARHSLDPDDGELHEGDPIVVERCHGLTLAVRRAEDWELVS